MTDEIKPYSHNGEKGLFELCREVWEETGWDSDDLLHFLGGEIHYKKLFESDMHHLNTTKDTYAPAYTSDYLLERLPAFVLNEWNDTYNLNLTKFDDGWSACYRQYDLYQHGVTGSTPLTALLRLVLELKKEG